MKALWPPAIGAGIVWRLLRFHPWRPKCRLELGDAHVEGRIWLRGTGRVQIGRGVRLIARGAAIELHAHAGGEIVIEDGVLIEHGTSIEATQSVRIGARSRIGPFCKIIDNHFHQTQDHRLGRPPSVPVVVGPDAIVGAHAVLLPGAELGQGAAVGPAAVLSFRLPAGCIFPGMSSATRPEA